MDDTERSEGDAQSPEDQGSAGLVHNLDQVDLAQAQNIGADPPGPLGLDLGGGTEGIGTHAAEEEADDLT